MLKFRNEAEFEKWSRALPDAQRRRFDGATARVLAPRVVTRLPPTTPSPTRARAAKRPGFRARAERAAAWFFVGVVGLSAWGLSLCVFGLAVRMYP